MSPVNKSNKPNPSFRKLKDWAEQYGRADTPDQQGIQTFMECETPESWRSLQAELIAITEGRFDEKVLDAVVGKRRKGKHHSYEEWAKLMLIWLASYKA